MKRLVHVVFPMGGLGMAVDAPHFVFYIVPFAFRLASDTRRRVVYSDNDGFVVSWFRCGDGDRH